MVTIKEYDLRDCFKTEKKLFTITGFYPTNGKNLYAYFILFFNYLICTTHLVSMIISIALNIKDMSKIITVLLFLMTHVTAMLKLFFFKFNNSRLLKILSILEKPIFYGFSEDQRQVMDENVKKTQLMALFYRGSCIITITFYAINPFLDEMENGLPLPGWIPFDVDKNLSLYICAFVFQMTSISIGAYNNSTYDSLDSMLITLASELFDILKQNMSNLDYTAENSSLELRKCIFLHIELLHYINEIESLYSGGLFIQFLASCLVICFTGFQMMMVDPASMQFTILCLYIMIMTLQVAMYCYFGHFITIKHSELLEACYMSNWYEAKIYDRKLLIILMERCKKPVLLSAGKFFILSLGTLLVILKSSYSYLAVLQRVYRDKKP